MSSAAESWFPEPALFLWFVGLGMLLVWQVFRDPAIDYRLVIAGVLLPDVVDAFFGRGTAPHSLMFSVVLLFGVMLTTRGRRHLRRRALALPIGTFVHLILDGLWTNTRLFWWPFFGTGFASTRLPSLSRPVLMVVLQELIGAIALVWCWRRFGLSDPARRTRLVRTGRLAPELRGG